MDFPIYLPSTIWIPRLLSTKEYAALFGNIRHFSTIFDFFWKFNNIRHYSTLFDNIQHYATIFDNIRHYWTIFDIIRQYSTFFDRRIMSKNVSVHNFYCRIMSRTSKNVAVHSGGPLLLLRFYLVINFLISIC